MTNSARARCTHVRPSPCACRYAATPNFTWHFSPVLSLVGGGYGYWAINLNGVQFKYSNGQSSAQLASGNSYAIVDTVRCGCGRAGVAYVADAVLCAGNVVHRSTCKPIQYHRPAGMLTGGCRCSLFALSRGVYVQIQQAQSDCVQDVNYIACPVCDYDALPTLEISLSVLVPGSAVTAPQTFVLTPQQYTCTNCGGNCQVMFQPVQGSYVGPLARALACLCHVSCRVVLCRSKQWILGDTFTEVCAPRWV